MSLKLYMVIVVPITFIFVYGLFTDNVPVVVASFISGLVLSQWYSGRQA